MANASTVTLSAAVKTLFERRLLMRALPRLVHGRWTTPARWKGYGTYEVRRWPTLQLVSQTLSEGNDPGETPVGSVTQITLTPNWYGSYVEYTDQLLLTSYDPALSEISALLGEQAGVSMDTILRNDLTDAATTDFAGGAAARTDVDATNDVISFADIIQNVAQLETQNALPVEGPYYACILHPHSWATLMQDSTFVTLFTREGGEALRNGQIGTILNLRLYISSNARIYVAGGTGSINVYDMLFIGKESYAVAGFLGLVPDWGGDGGGEQKRGGMTGGSIKVIDLIVKDLGETGFDPLNRRGTVGWKLTYSGTALNANWLRNLEHANDFS